MSLSLWSTTCTARRAAAEVESPESAVELARGATTAVVSCGGILADVAYDEALADRLREILYGEEGLTELRMFGGLAFLINGHMAVSASGQGGLLLRVDPADPRDLASRPGAQPFVMRGRRNGGMASGRCGRHPDTAPARRLGGDRCGACSLAAGEGAEATWSEIQWCVA